MSCDDFLYSHEGRFYAASQEKYDFYQRYLRVFEELRLVCRCEERKEIKKGAVSLDNDKRIEVFPVPMFHGPKQYAQKFFAVGRAIGNATKGCDAAILRIPSTTAMRVYESVKRLGIPYACEVVYDGEDGWKVTSGLTRLIWKRIDKNMRKICAGADGIACVTEHYLQKHYFSNKPDSFKSFYSSLALDKSFFSAPKHYPKHNTFTIAHVTNQIGFHGRKGNLELIQAVSFLKNKGYDVMIKFVGEIRDNSPEKVKQFANQLGVGERIEFLGYITRKELDKFLSNVDLFVLPTKAEGLPRVIIEAMAKGLPTITTPVSGCPELIAPHFLVDYDDVNTLADRIQELLDNPDLYEMTSKRNFEKAWEYEASVLEKRRDVFYSELKKCIK